MHFQLLLWLALGSLLQVLCLNLSKKKISFGRRQGHKKSLHEAAAVEERLSALQEHLDLSILKPSKHCDTIRHCLALKDTYEVIPFETWGKLSEGQQRDWQERKCNSHMTPDPKQCGQYMTVAEKEKHELDKMERLERTERRAKCAAEKPVKHALEWKTALQPTSKRPRLHVLTYATKLKEHMCHAIKLGLMWGINWTVIGLGEPWSGNLKQKFEGTLVYLQDLDPDDVVIFGDAFDVFYVGTEESIIDTYLAWDVSETQVFKLPESCTCSTHTC
jgi:hypothetical protein